MEGKYPDGVFKEEKSRIEDKILSYQIIINDELCNEYDIEHTVNFIRALFNDLPKAYETSEYGQSKVLLGSIYPQGLLFNGYMLLNHKIGAGFRAISGFTEGSVVLSVPKLTGIEPFFKFIQPLMLAYPVYKTQFVYLNINPLNYGTNVIIKYG